MYGSTARTWVVSVVRARRPPKGIVRAKAKGPGPTGQYEEVLLASAGSGDGGRSVVHRYVSFDHAVKVKIDVVVKSVAKLTVSTRIVRGVCNTQRLLLVLEKPAISWVLSPINVKFIYVPNTSLGKIWA